MVHCAWGRCANDDKYNKSSAKRPNAQFVGTRWIPWPKDPVQLQKWIKSCGTENLRVPNDVRQFIVFC